MFLVRCVLRVCTWISVEGQPESWHAACGRRPGRHHYDKQVRGGKMEEKKRWSCSCAVERDGSGVMTVVRSRLMWVVHRATWGHMMSWPTLPLRSMSGSIFMFMTLVITKSHEDFNSLGSCQGPWWCPRVMVMFRPMLQLWALSESVVLPQPGSVLMSVTHITIKSREMPVVWTAAWSHVDVQGQCWFGPASHQWWESHQPPKGSKAMGARK